MDVQRQNLSEIGEWSHATMRAPGHPLIHPIRIDLLPHTYPLIMDLHTSTPVVDPPAVQLPGPCGRPVHRDRTGVHRRHHVRLAEAVRVWRKERVWGTCEGVLRVGRVTDA